MAYGRSRHRSFGNSSGGGYFANGVLQANGSVHDLGGSDCTDVVGNPHGQNPFSLSKWHWQVRPLNGKGFGYPFNTFYEYRDFDRGIIPETDYGHLPINIPPLDYSGVLARTNPSRMDDSPLELIQDIADLPRQLKDVGKILQMANEIKKGRRYLSNLTNLRTAAQQNLAVQFGWLPFIQDVRKLFDFQAATHRRAAELHKLFSNQGLRRRISLGSSHAEASGLSQYSSATYAGIITYNASKTTSSKTWATVRWTPTQLPPLYPDTLEQLKLARKLVAGFSLEGLASGAWNVLPWTWMIDWFSNVGSFIAAGSNTVPASSGAVCIMTTVETQVTWSRLDALTKEIEGWDGSVIYVSKSRDVGGLSLEATLPFLGAKRLSILGSLAIQRITKLPK
jgi:hypothetical protein